MIVRTIICCETCQKPFLIRVSLGSNQKHSHKFECPNCNELIELIAHLKTLLLGSVIFLGDYQYTTCRR
jgi:hypothetical protein